MAKGGPYDRLYFSNSNCNRSHRHQIVDAQRLDLPCRHRTEVTLGFFDDLINLPLPFRHEVLVIFIDPGRRLRGDGLQVIQQVEGDMRDPTTPLQNREVFLIDDP
jgi:hypothetical protein